MGGDTSKSVSDVLTDIAIDAAYNQVSRHVTTASQSQLIKIRGVGGDVNISNIRMKQGSTVNIRSLMSSDVQSKIQNDIATAIVQKAESKGISLIGALGRTKSEVRSRIRSILRTNVRIDNIQEEYNNAIQRQELNVGWVKGNVVIGNVDMEQTMKMTAEILMTSTSYAVALNKIANSVEQTATAKQENFLDPIMKTISSVTGKIALVVGGIVIAGAIVMIFVAKYFFTGVGGTTTPPAVKLAPQIKGAIAPAT